MITRWPILSVRVLRVAEVVGPWHTGLAPAVYRRVVEANAKDLGTAKTEQPALARNAVPHP